MFSTTEITSHEETSDNVIHQRLLFAYEEASRLISGKILELGCGAGRGMELVAAACADYTGIDKNTELLKQHTQTYPNFTFLNQNIPPFEGIEDNTFDFVISFQVIEHIQDDALFLKEIHRVLKPSGKAIISTPNIKLSLTRNPWHIREYTPKELTKLMEKHFSKVTMKGVYGSKKIMQYFEENRDSVAKITRFDIFNLQYKLPRQLLQIPYDILNRINRKKLQNENSTLVNDVTVQDYFLKDDAENSFDLFAIVEK